MDTGKMFSRQKLYVMFDALINTDYGMITTIKEVFPNNKYLEYDIFEYESNQIKHLLLTRTHENPLCLVAWDHSWELYDEIYNMYRSQIHNNSTFTNIVNMLITTRKLDNIEIVIVCKDLQDKHFIDTQHSDIMGDYKSILLEDISFKDSDYLYANKTRDIINREDISGMNIYLFRSMYNLQYNKEEKLYEMRPHVDEMSKYSVVKFLSPYIMDDSYKIERND